jgi:DNA primase
MNNATDETIKEEVRSRADIAKVIGRYVKLQGKGSSLKGLCPFHKEKTPSFHVNAQKGFFHCFGCGKGGDVFNFLQEIENIGFFEALKMLADETGVELRSSTETTHEQKSGPQISKTELLRVHEIAAKFYYSMIRSSPEAIQYLKSRGLTGEIVRDFRLGFAPPGWSSLIDHCKKSGIPVSTLIAAGLAIDKENGSGYDRFRNRVIFSLFDLSGKVIGFAGRGMSDKEQPKYLNSPETVLYRKKELLYGLFMARNAIKERGYVIVVEGYMDYLSLYQSGVKNVVAVSGTAFTEEHAHLLKRFTSKIVLIFDGDAAGQTAARRAVEVLAPVDVDVSILILPNDEDPDDFVKRAGPDAFLELVKTATPWVPFIIDRVASEFDISTPFGQSSAVSALQPILNSIHDPIIAQQFKKQLAEKVRLDEKIIYTKSQEDRYNNKSLQVAEKPGVQLADEEKFLMSLEGRFLSILLTNPEYVAEASQYVVPETLTDSVSSDIYSFILDTYEETGSIDTVLDHCDDPTLKRLMTSLLVRHSYPDHVHEELVQKIIHLREKYLRDRIRDAKLKMKSEPHRRTELLREMQDFTTQLQELQRG